MQVTNYDSAFLRDKTGVDKLRTPQGILIFVGIAFVSYLLMKVMGLMGGMILLALPVAFAFLGMLWDNPKIGVWAVLIMNFFIAGLGRYVPAPWGLTVDILLLLCWLSVILNKKVKFKKKHLKNDIVYLTCGWMGYLVFEIVNPSGNGPIAWFYAMRAIGFYNMLTIPLIFILFRSDQDIKLFIRIIFIISLLATAWGFKQNIIGLDAAENYWLYDLDHAEEHILHGVLRTFSFYSDAGAFGASQAMMLLICGILAMGPFKMRERILYGVLAIIFLMGFGISGTRGALMVPAAGALSYLVLIKNFKILMAGLIGMITIFVILKYTFMFQGVEQVRRMRTALDPNNASLNVRYENQKTFARYLRNKPFGGGVGTAGFWGARFNPNSLMANTATDSWYVKIWAETGIIGLTFHLVIIGYTMGRAGARIMASPNTREKTYAMAFFASLTGVVFCSYGNQVFAQMPTGAILNMMIPFMFLLTRYKYRHQDDG